MKLLSIDDLAVQPWKNGGGVTRELARADGEQGMIWRLSFADVEKPGPFSHFPGLRRVLTVLSGAGLRLRHADGIIDALPGAPARFDGDVAIDCDLIGGAVRDFNLIFDPARTEMDVLALSSGEQELSALAIVPLSGDSIINGEARVKPGAVALFDDLTPLRIVASGAALAVTGG